MGQPVRYPPPGAGGGSAVFAGPLDKLCRCVRRSGWRCLSTEWHGYHSLYVFECAQGHRCERSAAQMMYQKTPCRECRNDHQRQQWLAKVEAYGGMLVEGTFTGLLHRYRLRCVAGHEWDAQGRKIAEGSWCPQCRRAAAGQRRRLEAGLAQLQEVARARGGRCLSTQYDGTKAEYQWECACGHRWWSTGTHVRGGSWCPRCAAQKRAQARRSADGLDRLRAAAGAQGGQCLANEYTGTIALYRFRCAAGHEWETDGGIVLRGHWCPQCARERGRSTLERMRAVARSRGGRCLSDAYHGAHVRLAWACHLGHVWTGTPASVVNGGTWCPNCAVLNRTKKRCKRVRYDVEG